MKIKLKQIIVMGQKSGKFFYSKCVISYERDSDYAFKKCGRQCTCEQCCQKKGDNDISKSILCRT